MTTIKSITEAKNLLPTLRAQKSYNIRKKNGENTIVLFNDGEKYTAYGMSAIKLYAYANARVITTDDYIDMTTINKIDEYRIFPRLVKAGLKIAII